MKLFLLTAGLALLISSAAYAQSSSSNTKPAAASEKASPASTADESVKATCKDGTPYSGKSLHGACRGHGGLEKEQSAKGSEKDSKSSSSKGESDATASKSKTSSTAGTTGSAGATGGSGKVWANEDSKVYHCAGDRYYGKTKKGEYMSEADAKEKGFRPDHGKACSS